MTRPFLRVARVPRAVLHGTLGLQALPQRLHASAALRLTKEGIRDTCGETRFRCGFWKSLCDKGGTPWARCHGDHARIVPSSTFPSLSECLCAATP